MNTEKPFEIPTFEQVLGRSTLRPHTQAWRDFAVPYLRWVVGGSPENNALIVLSLGAVTQ